MGDIITMKQKFSVVKNLQQKDRFRIAYIVITAYNIVGFKYCARGGKTAFI